MAQIGSRLIDAAAAKITEDFFKAFEAHLQAASAPAGAAATASATSPAVREGDGGLAKLWWLIGALVVLAIVYFAIRR
jgi:hypothetical protein